MRKPTIVWMGVVAALVFCAGVIAVRSRQAPASSVRSAKIAPPAASGGAAVPNAANPPPGPPRPPVPAASLTYASFRTRPFPVTQETGNHQWTAEDARSPDVIRQLAHNDLEYQRMLEENDRIKRRQLVYVKDSAAAQVERARLTGAPIQTLVLPGLDGQEVQFEVTKADLAPSGLSGTFSGRVAGQSRESLVTLAFKSGREAFTVISPADGIYLQADPRESGEVIVKSIDPNKYVLGKCGAE